MTANEQALDQAVMKLIAEIAIGRAGGRSNVAIVDAVEEAMPELRRLRGEVWLELQARTLKPRKPRRTQAWIRKNGMAQRAAARAAGPIQ